MSSSTNTHDVARGYDSGTRPGQPDAFSGQGARGQRQPSQPVALAHYPGSSIVSTFPPSHQRIVTSPSSQIVYQPPIRSPGAPPDSNGGHSTSLRSNNTRSIPSGTYASNSPAVHVPLSPLAPASPIKQPWSEASYNAAGGPISAPYPTAGPGLQLSPSARTKGGRVPSQSHGSSPTSPNNTHQTRLNMPQCKLPQCDKPAIFDPRINEQREYCQEHIKSAISVGFATCCRSCGQMPARLDSEFCSVACSDMSQKSQNAHRVASSSSARGPISYSLPTLPQPQVHPRVTEEKTTRSGENPTDPKVKKPSGGSNGVPDGLGQTCQECRRHMKESRSRYCSKECEDASRKFRASRR